MMNPKIEIAFFMLLGLILCYKSAFSLATASVVGELATSGLFFVEWIMMVAYSLGDFY